MKTAYLDNIRGEYLAFQRRYKNVPGRLILNMKHSKYKKFMRLTICLTRASGWQGGGK